MSKYLKKATVLALMSAVLPAAAYAQESPVAVYYGYVKAALVELVSSLRNIGGSYKFLLIAGLVIAAVLLYLRNRDTPSNNTRKARNLHKKAVELHQAGRESEATKYYELAAELRKKATEQQ